MAVQSAILCALKFFRLLHRRRLTCRGVSIDEDARSQATAQENFCSSELHLKWQRYRITRDSDYSVIVRRGVQTM